jgi:hypothetical protein
MKTNARSLAALGLAVLGLSGLACSGSPGEVTSDVAAAVSVPSTLGQPGQLDQHFTTGVGNPVTVELWPLGNPDAGGGSTCSGAELDITYVDSADHFSGATTMAAWLGITEVGTSGSTQVNGYQVLTESSVTTRQYSVAVCLATGDTTQVAMAFTNASHTRWDSNYSKNYTLTFSPPPTVNDSCGGQTCYAGQACVSGACTFTTCTGSQVPGDYATIQDAVNALATADRLEIICLGAGTYAENVDVAEGSIALQGLSSGQTVLTSLTMTYAVGLGDIDLSIQGVRINALSFRSGANPGAGSASITASSLGSLTIDAGYETLSVNLDGVDVSAGAGGAALSIGQSNGSFALSVENSYIHDSLYGLDYTVGEVPFGTASLTLLNNTFERDTTAVSIPEGCVDLEVCSQPSITSFDNIFASNGVAIETQANDVVTDGSNALFGNTANYAGLATAGAGYVTANPVFDTSTTPPGLLAGSPCRGAANATYATTHDFWGRPRGTRADIGAVQSSP